MKEIIQQLYATGQWPESIQVMFPMIALFYKKNTSKPRKRITGYHTSFISAQSGQPKKYKHKALQKYYRNQRTSLQNQYSFVSCLLIGPGDYGTVKRSLKHKGYSKLIAGFYATPQEMDREKNNWRYCFRKFRTIADFFNSRSLDDARFGAICQQLGRRYPTPFNQGNLFME